jgi:hypothetical protein
MGHWSIIFQRTKLLPPVKHSEAGVDMPRLMSLVTSLELVVGSSLTSLEWVAGLRPTSLEWVVGLGLMELQ